MMIEKFIRKENFNNFLILVRLVRKWAKRKGLYGNKAGNFTHSLTYLLTYSLTHLLTR